MRQFFFRFPRAYRLKPVAQREEDALSLLRIGANNQSVLVPFSLGAGLCRRLKRGRGAPDQR